MKKDIKKQTVVIHGEVPAKKNSYRYGARGLYKPEGITSFEQMIEDSVLEQRVRRMDGPLKVFVKVWTATNGDLDNKVTTLLDALQDAGVFENDKEVMWIEAEKVTCAKGQARASVVLEKL